MRLAQMMMVLVAAMMELAKIMNRNDLFHILSFFVAVTGKARLYGARHL
jgi:hypothetical protein